MVATILIYVNSFRNGFIDFDDPDNVLDNYSIRGFNLANLEHFFTTPLQYMYTPLVSISYAIDYHFGKLGPFAYHFTNLALHLCNIVLVYQLCRALTKKVFIAHFVTIAFAIHPANVDTVSWISTRSTLLATAFSLGALLVYIRYARKLRWPYLLASVLLFVLAVLSKSTAVALVLCLPVLDYCRGRKLSWRLVLEKVPFGVVALVGGLLTLHFRIDTDALYSYSPVDRIVIMCAALTAYLVRLIVPYPLAFAYAYPAKTGAFLPWYLYLTPLVLCLVVLLLYRTNVSKKLLLFGLTFFAFNIVLSQSALLEDNYKSNRYAYLPYIGLLLILGELVRGLVESRHGWRARLAPVWPALLTVFVVFFAVATISRSSLWNEPVHVLDNSIKHEPGVPFIYNSRGMTEYKNGNYTAAQRDFEKTISLDPRFTLSYYYRGVIKSLNGDYQGAIADYNEALALSPGFNFAYCERGKAELALKDYSNALADLSRSIAGDNYFVDAFLNRGEVYAAMGNNAAAISDYDRAAQLYPNYPEVYNYRGVAVLATGDIQAAVRDFDTAIQLSPQFGEAYFNRGNAKRQLNDTAGACVDWRASQTYGYPQASQTVQANCSA